ncbi:MAG TPA: ATP-binding protein [Thermoanaerobaculia bacterium]|jgi:PAS domain S-box-containing protein
MRAPLRYLIAAASTAAAFALTSALGDFLAPMRLFFFWCAILLTAVAAGTGPAIVALALSLLGAAYLVFHPIGSIAVAQRVDVLRMAMFALFSAGISVAVGLRRRAEERAAVLTGRMRYNELRYRTLVEATPLPQAVWSAQPDGKIAWSDEWLTITGLTREEVDRGEAMKVIHPDDAPRTIERWELAVSKETFYADEIRVRTAGGRYRWFAIKAVPVFGDDGRVVEWIGIIADIHDRKRHEEEAAFINRATAALTSSLNHDATLRALARLCVPEIADWCAIHMGEDEHYERLVVEHSDPSQAELVRRLDRRARSEASQDAILRVLKTQEPQLVEWLADEAIEQMAPEQSEILRELGLRSWIIAPMVAHGRTLGALTVVQARSGRRYGAEDLTLVGELARRAGSAIENARLYEAAQAASRAKDEFLATLSHELRTPLTAISGWAHMLQLGIADAETSRTAIDTIVRSAKAQSELIDDLLDLSRVTAGTLHLQVANVDLAKLAGEIVTAARPAAEAKHLTLELETETPEIIVRGDDRRLRQIVWNLVSNAVKFTDRDGTVRVRVSAHGEQARITVSDTGRGIEPAFLPYVWDRFRQADSSTSRQYGGLGLGLAVVRQLAELHGGTVRAESEGIGRGSTFIVELPVARATDANAAAPAATASAAPLHGKHVLVVDDDPDARLVLRAMLEKAGSRVTAVASVEQALRMMSDDGIDVVVSDIAMPGEDGYALARRAREVSQAPLIAVSAIGAGLGERDRALAAGFAAFLPKPVDPTELADSVARLVERHASGFADGTGNDQRPPAAGATGPGPR